MANFDNGTYIKYPFAQDGDKTAIGTVTSSGSVTWQSGYDSTYAISPSSGGNVIDRAEFNYILNHLSKGLNQYQIHGGRIYDANIGENGDGYPLGARVLVYYNIFKNKIIKDFSSNDAYLTILIPLVSMVDSNKTSPYDTNALFGDWWIDDGVEFGGLKILSINEKTGTETGGAVPDGYVDIGKVSQDSLLFSNYPRVKSALTMAGVSNSETWGVFYKVSDTEFKIIDCRSAFMRVFNNGGTQDSGRSFNTLQSSGAPDIVGSVENFRLLYTGGTGSLSGAFSGSVAGLQVYEMYSGASAGAFNQGGFTFRASLSSSVYQDGLAEVRPYNFNIKVYVKC